VKCEVTSSAEGRLAAYAIASRRSSAGRYSKSDCSFGRAHDWMAVVFAIVPYCGGVLFDSGG
jgi:hypothetical protein